MDEMKKLIRLTEQDLHRIVKESVRKIIKESGDSLSDAFKEEVSNYYRNKGWTEEQIDGILNDFVEKFINRGYSEEDFANLWRNLYLRDRKKELDSVLDYIFTEFSCWNSKLGNDRIRIESPDRYLLEKGIDVLEKYGFKPSKVVKAKERHSHGAVMSDVWYAYYDDFK